jgi:hypothetical protein
MRDWRIIKTRNTAKYRFYVKQNDFLLPEQRQRTAHNRSSGHLVFNCTSSLLSQAGIHYL